MNTSAALEAALRDRPSVSLEQLNAAASLQTRIDRKYVVGVQQAADLLQALPVPLKVLEIAGRRRFAYESVYFDTPALDSYLLAARGRRRRYKIRTRTYADSGLCFLEVKTEGARAATVKERIPYPLEAARRITPEGREYINETLQAAVGSVPSGVLSPVIDTGYGRITVFLPETCSRATVDLDVTWRRSGAVPKVLQGAVILETKSGFAASDLDRTLWAHGIRPSRISKFATGLAALEPGLPSNRWHRTLSRDLTLRALPEFA